MTLIRRRLRGATLVEALVVLAILGLLAGLATLALRLPAGIVLDRTAGGILSDLGQARSAALTQKTTILARFDAEARSFTVPALGLGRDLPWRVSARATGAAEAQAAQSAPKGTTVDILFYPDASTSGADIVLAAGQQRRLINVHWLTGQVQYVTD